MIKNILIILIWGISVVILQHLLSYSAKLSLLIFVIGLLLWVRFRKNAIINLIPLLVFVVSLIWLSTIQASNQRDWIDEVSRLPEIIIENNEVTIKEFRNFSWNSVNDSNLNWETRTYDLNKLQGLSLIVVPFHDSKYMAHTMLGFNFEGHDNIIISVETRKEKNEDYSLIAGALKQLELIYVFGSEQDLLTLRAVHRKSSIYMYPIKADTEFIKSIFKDLSRSANALHTVPQFYRTLRDNCTTTLVRHIDLHYQQKIGIRTETIFPAKAGELLYELGRMDTQLSYEQAHQASRIDPMVKEYEMAEDFSSLLHENPNILGHGKN